MEQRNLIDTNIIIDNFGNKLPANAKTFLNDLEITISAVTQIEVLGWLHATEQQLKPLHAFMELATILSINETVIEKNICNHPSQKDCLG